MMKRSRDRVFCSVPSAALGLICAFCGPGVYRLWPSASQIAQPVTRVDVNVGRDDDAEKDPARQADVRADEGVNDPSRDRCEERRCQGGHIASLTSLAH